MEYNPHGAKNNDPELKQWLRESDYATFKLFPLHQWGDQTYAVASDIDLVPGMQRIEVYNVTDILDDIVIIHDAYRPEQRYTVIIWPHEGHTSYQRANGGIAWIHTADLPIRVIPGTPADMTKIREMQMDELEASVDAGGSVVG